MSNFTVENFQQLYEVFIELYGEQNYFYLMKYRILQGGSILLSDCIIQEKGFITGSNARMLSKELGTYLTGCYIAIELYPFHFLNF